MSNPSFLYYDPRSLPLNANGVPMPGGTLNFYYTGTTTPAPVYADAGLTQQYPPTDLESDSMGRFPAIYLDSTIAYRSQLYDQNGILYEDIDPINSIQTNVNYSVSKVLTTGRVGTTVTNDPELVVTLATGTYALSGFISYRSPSSPGGGIVIGMSTNNLYAAGTGFVFNGVSGSGSETFGLSPAFSLTCNWDTSSNYGTYYQISISGSVIVASPAQVAFQWGQYTSTTGGTQVFPGSYLYFTKVNAYNGFAV